MIEGTYDIVSETPLGEREGTLELEGSGDQLVARIELMGMREAATGTADGDSFTFVGETRVMLRRFAYEVNGTVMGGRLLATMHALDRDFIIKGKLR